MRRRGVSQGAALAYWLGNPALNPAVLVFIAFALGWAWALLRLALGLVLVLGVPWLATSALGRRFWSERPARARVELGLVSDPGEPAPGGALADVLAETPAETDQWHQWGVRWLASLARLCVRLIPEYVVVMLVLGAARAWLFPVVGAEAGNSLPVIVGLAIAGALFAIPTAGEIPIIQTMRGFGLGAGPAGALLMTLAPISLPSLLMVAGVFPRRVLVFVTVATVVLGLVAGLLATAVGL